MTEYSFILNHLDGSKIHLKTTEVIQPGSVMKVVGQGMPVKNSLGESGDLYINFKVVLPDSPLSEDQAKLLSFLPVAPSISPEDAAEAGKPLSFVKVENPEGEEEDYFDEEHAYDDEGEEGEGESGDGDPSGGRGGGCSQQ